jgi:hypothetical protein
MSCPEVLRMKRLESLHQVSKITTSNQLTSLNLLTMNLPQDIFAIDNEKSIYTSPSASDSTAESPPSKHSDDADDVPNYLQDSTLVSQLLAKFQQQDGLPRRNAEMFRRPDSENVGYAAETSPTSLTVPTDTQAEEKMWQESPAGSHLVVLGDSWDDMYE